MAPEMGEDGEADQVTLKPPDDFFDRDVLAKLREEAIKDTHRLLRCVLPLDGDNFDGESDELRVVQELEDDEFDCRHRALRVARRQIWRERMRHRARLLETSPEADLGNANLTSQTLELAEIDRRTAAVEAELKQRHADLESLENAHDEVENEIKEWGQTCTNLKAMAEEQREGQRYGEQVAHEPVSGRRQATGSYQMRHMTHHQPQTQNYVRPESTNHTLPQAANFASSSSSTLARVESMPVLVKPGLQNATGPIMGYSKSVSWLPSAGMHAPAGVSSPGGFVPSPGGSLQIPAHAVGGLASPGGFCNSPGSSLQAPVGIVRAGIASPGGFSSSRGGSLQAPARPASLPSSGLMMSMGGSLQVPARLASSSGLSRGAVTLPAGGSLQVAPAVRSPGRTSQPSMQVASPSPEPVVRVSPVSGQSTRHGAAPVQSSSPLSPGHAGRPLPVQVAAVAGQVSAVTRVVALPARVPGGGMPGVVYRQSAAS